MEHEILLNQISRPSFLLSHCCSLNTVRVARDRDVESISEVYGAPHWLESSISCLTTQICGYNPGQKGPQLFLTVSSQKLEGFYCVYSVGANLTYRVLSLSCLNIESIRTSRLGSSHRIDRLISSVRPRTFHHVLTFTEYERSNVCATSGLVHPVERTSLLFTARCLVTHAKIHGDHARDQSRARFAPHVRKQASREGLCAEG